VSPDQAIEMGIQQYEPGQQSQGGVYQIDEDLNAYVNRVGQKLASASEAYYLPYEFVVLNNGVPNAWALPGGKIAVNRGLLVELEDEAQLAAVLGHEVVHAAANHGASQMSRSALLNIGLMAGGILAQDSEYSDLISMGSQIGSAAWMASYGRDDELESDEHGMRYMAIVGYDPQAAVELQETFVRLSEGQSSDFITGLFASHPPSQQRVDANIAHAASLPSGGIRNRDAYQRAIAQIVADQPAYDAQERAVKALNDENADLALAFLDQAIELQPDEGQFWELRGHAWKMKDDLNNAETAFGTAINKNSDYFQHWLVRGLLRKEMGKTSLAEEDLQHAEDLLPTSSAAYALGEIAESRGDMQTAISYYSAVAGSGGEIGQLASVKVVRYDLPSNPGNYIASTISTDGQGRMIALVRNDAGIPTSNIKVRLTLSSSGLSRDYDIRGSLDAGQQGSVNTGIVADPSLYSLRVIQATPR
jgi:predicted Zn-dependent protease